MSNNTSTDDRRRLVIPLTAVSVVCHARLGLDSLAPEISAFIASDSHRRWTIELACERGHEQLLRCLVALEPADTDPFLRSHVFSKALIHAVRHDNLALLESLRDYCPIGFASWGMEEAAASGKVHLLEWITTNCENVVWNLRIYNTAAERGQIAALEWLTAYWIRLNDGRSTETELWHLCGSMENATEAGHFEAVQWLYENVNRFVENECHECAAIFGAFRSGRMEIVKYLYERGYRLNHWRYGHPIDMVIRGGCSSLEDVKWLYENGFGETRACLYAAENGFTDIVSWLLEHGTKPKDRHYELHAAAKNGHLEIVKLLSVPETYAPSQDGDERPRKRTHSRTRPCPGDCYSYALVGAAAGGHFDVVQWLFDNLHGGDSLNRRHHNQSAISEAAANGHFEVAEWLYGRAKAEDPEVFAQRSFPAHHYRPAIDRSNVDALTWLKEHLPCTESNRDNESAAVKKGRLDVLKWLHACVGGYLADSYLIDAAAGHGHLDIVKWLHALQKPVQQQCSHRAMDNAARNNHLDVVKWLHANRTEGCTTAAMDGVASFEMVAWLHENRSEGCTTLAMDNAAEKGDLETLVYLHKYRTEGCTVSAAHVAHCRDSVDVLRWLLTTYPDVLSVAAVAGSCSLRSSDWYTSSLMKTAMGRIDDDEDDA